MFRLVYSNQLEALAHCVGVAIEESRASSERNLLSTDILVVPHQAVGEYLRSFLARTQGVSSCLTITTPLGFVDRVVRASGPWAVLSRSELQGMFLNLFLDTEALKVPSLAPVRDYLHAGGNTPGALARRQASLSAELTQLFLGYDLHRPELLASWVQDPLSEKSFLTTERWQRAIWSALFGKEGDKLLAPQTGAHHRLLSFWVQPAVFRTLVLPPCVHFFGFSSLERTVQHLLAGLADRSNVWMYTPNPSQEFWGDLAPFSSRSAQVLVEPSFVQPTFAPLGTSEDPLALRCWGGVWQKQLRLLDELSQGDHLQAFVDPYPPPLGASSSLTVSSQHGSVLQQLHHQLLHRIQGTIHPDTVREGEDPSLLLFACPSVRRELETVAETLDRLLRTPPLEGKTPLLPEEIAVVLATREDPHYTATLRAVFDEFRLPYLLTVPLPLTPGGGLLHAVRRLILLPGGELLRQDLLHVLTYPGEPGGLVPEEISLWSRWCDTLGVVRGGDGHVYPGTYVESERYSVDQALRRLALGLLTEREDLPPLPDGEALPHSVPLAEQESLGRFVLRVRSLLSDVEFARSAQLSMADWALFFQTLVTTYLAPSPHDPIACLCRDALHTLSLLGVTPPVSYALAAECAEAALARVQLPVGEGGIAVYPLLPMRSLPARVVCVVGLSEGGFPAPDRGGPRDLRSVDRPAWDPSPGALDRLAFLELLLAARERIYLSYVSRDLHGEERVPSSVLRELDTVLTGFGKHPEAALVRRVVPPFRTATCSHPAVAGEDLARALHADLVQRGTPSSALSALRAALSPSAYRTLVHRVHLPSFPHEPSPAAATQSTSLELPFSALHRFLQCPLQGYAETVCGLRSAEEDLEEEPVSISSREGISFLRQVFWRSLETGEALDTVYRETLARLARTTPLPSGFFAEIDRTLHRNTLQTWKALTAEETSCGLAAPLWFGRAPEEASASTLRPFLLFTLPRAGMPPLEVKLHGRVEGLVSPERATLLRLLQRSGSLQEPRDLLRGFLDHLLLSAAGGMPGPSTLVLAHAASSRIRKVVWHPCTQEVSRAHLTHLLEDLLVTPSFFFFPGEVAFLYAKLQKPLVDLLDTLRASGRHSAAYGPIPHADRHPSPSPEQAEALFARRYALLFALWNSSDAGSPGSRDRKIFL